MTSFPPRSSWATRNVAQILLQLLSPLHYERGSGDQEMLEAKRRSRGGEGDSDGTVTYYHYAPLAAREEREQKAEIIAKTAVKK